MFGADVIMPIGPRKTVDLDRFDALGRESVGPLPTELGAETSAFLFELAIDGAAPERPPGGHFLIGPDDGVVMALAFERAHQNLIVGAMIGGMLLHKWISILARHTVPPSVGPEAITDV